MCWKRTTLAKQPWPDGWRIAELKLWREPILRWVADLLVVVEDTGKWPAELLRGKTVLLPKGGFLDPLDRPHYAAPHPIQDLGLPPCHSTLGVDATQWGPSAGCRRQQHNAQC